LTFRVTIDGDRWTVRDHPYEGQVRPSSISRGTVTSFYVENFGCRATQADGAAIERQFRERGLERADGLLGAELVVLNTCTVTSSADQDARAAIRRIHRENPGCQIVVTGCYAQRAPEELAALPGVSQVIGNSHKHRLVEIALPGWGNLETQRSPGDPAESATGFVPLSSLTFAQTPGAEDRAIFVSDIFAHTELLAAPVFDAANERTRPTLKVQDGCDNRCSFCVIPSVRGQSRSLPLVKVLDEVNALVAAGYREVVISGINLGRWGRDLGPVTSAAEALTEDAALDAAPKRCSTQNHANERRHFEDLVRAILDNTRLEKLRISSVEPMDWSDELIELVALSSRIAKHAHVPMQSGSDRILRRMHRKYRPWHYREKIEKIRSAMPTAAIGADVMVGFPGETDADFEATRRMVEELPFTYLHVFTYSPRPGTAAASMGDQVPVYLARERNQVLRSLIAEKKRVFMRSFVGRLMEAITLNVVHPDAGEETTEALTDNYLKLWLKGRHPASRWVNARIQEVGGTGLVGALA